MSNSSRSSVCRGNVAEKIVIGLAITTMCIDLVGIQYIRKIHYFGRAIQDARYALVNVGGKMVHVGDLMRYAQFLHRKYGLNEAHAHIIENPLARMFPHAYIPDDIAIIRYIDYIGGSSQSLFHLQQTTENNNYQLVEATAELENLALTTISNRNATIQSPSMKREPMKKRSKMAKEP